MGQELVSVRKQARVLYQMPAVPSSHFTRGRAFIKPENFAGLEPVADFLLRHPGWKILVEGHTDSIPMNTKNFPDNDSLSVARARSIERNAISIEPSPALSSGSLWRRWPWGGSANRPSPISWNSDSLRSPFKRLP